MSAPDRRAMLDRADKTLSIGRQCALLGVSRSGVYRPKKPANDNDLVLMRRIDELFTAWPFLFRVGRPRCWASKVWRSIASDG
jgi:putative transposase